MKTLKRALRRHHSLRIAEKRQGYWGGHAKQSKRLLGICTNTPCVCSCYSCGNQRKHWGKDHAEKRQRTLYT